MRVEILLPVEYNDGKVVENEKFSQTIDEIVEHFSGCSMNDDRIIARWKDPITKVPTNDKLRLWVICKHNKENIEFLKAYKSKLCVRFQQKEIMMTRTEVSTTF